MVDWVTTMEAVTEAAASTELVALWYPVAVMVSP
jgi:hypothetical protein